MSERRLAAVRRGRMGQGAQAAITVAHASGNGVSASDPNHFLAFGSGLCQIFRMKGEFDFAVNAGAMADWTSPGEKAPCEMPSSDSKAFCFACRSSSPGSGAKQRAAFCQQKGSQHGERVDAN